MQKVIKYKTSQVLITFTGVVIVYLTAWSYFNTTLNGTFMAVGLIIGFALGAYFIQERIKETKKSLETKEVKQQ